MLHPIVKWAQRKDKVFLQVQLRDITNQTIQLTETTLTFSGNSDKQKYGFAFEFFSQIDKDASKWTRTGFHLIFVLQKKDVDASFWARLLKTKDKNQYLQVDWSKWIDEDEQQQQADKGMGGMDPSQMRNFGGGMGGMPGMGGMGGMPGMGGMGGFPGMGGMGGMGGFPGMGGMGGMPGMGGFGGMPGMGDFEGGDEGDQQEQGQQEQHHEHGPGCNHEQSLPATQIAKQQTPVQNPTQAKVQSEQKS